MSDDKLYEAIQKGDRAKALLEDEILNEALAEMRNDMIELWERTTPKDVIAREKLYVAINQLGLFKRRLQVKFDGGKIAQADLNMRQRKAA